MESVGDGTIVSIGNYFLIYTIDLRRVGRGRLRPCEADRTVMACAATGTVPRLGDAEL